MNIIPPSHDRYIVQYTLRLFFRPHSMSKQAGFSFVFLEFSSFFFLLSTDCSIRLWNFLNLAPFSRTWILTRPPVPPHPKLLGKKNSAKRKLQPLSRARRYWCVTLSAQACTLPLCTPQPHPSRTHGIGWFWLSGTIPNKGFLLMQ